MGPGPKTGAFLFLWGRNAGGIPALYCIVGEGERPSGYEIIRGGLRQDGRIIDIPKGLLYLALARAGWRGEDGPLSLDMIRRLRLLDRRLSALYLRPDRESAA
jgi:hypothetical protein